MPQEPATKNLAESFGQLFTSFEEALSEIFNDPELGTKAKDFGSGAAESANALISRFKDEKVKEKFAQIAFAAKEFGDDLAHEAEELFSKMKEAGNYKSSPEEKAGDGAGKRNT